MMHAESDCYFETFNESGYRAAIDEWCDDVTGLPEHEQRFKDTR